MKYSLLAAVLALALTGCSHPISSVPPQVTNIPVPTTVTPTSLHPATDFIVDYWGWLAGNTVGSVPTNPLDVMAGR